MIETCFHCQQPIPRDVRVVARIESSRERGDIAFCCHGCRAVAQFIAQTGLSDYYRFRDTPALTARPEPDRAWRVYDDSTLLEQVSQVTPDGVRVATLVLEGIGCAACGWLIDKALRRKQGIVALQMSVATGRLTVHWRQEQLALSAILRTLAQLGFAPHVATPNSLIDAARSERRVALKRLAVAGFGMMQVMMFALAFYVGGVESEIEAYFRYVSLLCATPVLFYAGEPFLLGAWRAVRGRSVTMDVPVSIGLLLAYFASVFNTWTGSGDVYFDAVTMFVFFLALARFVEMTARHRTLDVTDALARLLPTTAHRVSESGQIEDVAVATLRSGEEVWIRVGETVPADGVVVEGSSRLDESMLTGESMPVARAVGSPLAAGTVNVQSALRMRITAIGAATALSHIVRLIDAAPAGRSPRASAADRAAQWFLTRILFAAAIVYVGWLMIDPTRAFDAVLAVLVVTCPCALSLATPVALTAATRALARRGVLLVRAGALEELATITHAMFDKTGTLTCGEPVLVSCESSTGVRDLPRYRAMAAALEQGSEHPLATAFRDASALSVTERRVAECGVEGVIDGRTVRLGRRDYVAALRGAPTDGNDDERIFLGDSERELAAFRLADRVRDDASAVVKALRARHIECSVLSGDAPAAVARTAHACGIWAYHARQSPEDKLQQLRRALDSRERVAMIGDGVNDAPVLRAATVSIAVTRASALAQASADVLLLGDRLDALPAAIDMARRTQRVIKQNLLWAMLYNAAALPLAALGFVPPWLAAVGMSLSSMLVVLNALRLARAPRRNLDPCGTRVGATPRRALPGSLSPMEG